jgi:NAD(P)-dependent dehydrogenase (short-subunit alcohol dehydrogenase family)
MHIAGAAALVTGGASGLGEATVRRLAAAGACVTIVDKDTVRGEALADELSGPTRFVTADVTDVEQVEAAVALAGESAPLRVAISCAGIGSATRTVNRAGVPHDAGLFKLVVQINLFGTFNVMRLAAAAISQSEPDDGGERGVIINTASAAAFDGQIGQTAYSASKSGIVGMTLPAARDLAPAGIRVNTIAPGLMDTPLLALVPDEQRDALSSGFQFPKRPGAGDEFARLVLSVIENAYLNGETIRLDGAMRMGPR